MVKKTGVKTSKRKNKSKKPVCLKCGSSDFLSAETMKLLRLLVKVYAPL